jgi:hypothetical protein
VYLLTEPVEPAQQGLPTPLSVGFELGIMLGLSILEIKSPSTILESLTWKALAKLRTIRILVKRYAQTSIIRWVDQ